MSKPTVSAVGGAMPASGPSREPNPSKMSDQIDIIKALVDAAFMASNELTDFHREAMRRLLDDTSSKVGEVQKKFTEFYCGGYVDNVRGPVAATAFEDQKKPSLLDLADAIDTTKHLIVAVAMLAAELNDIDGNALNAVICAAEEKLIAARAMLATIRGEKSEAANV